MPASYTRQYPAVGTLAALEQPLWLKFSTTPYSLIASQRTRSYISANSQIDLVLPLPKEPGYQVRHEYGEGTNPVGPVLSLASLQNSGGDFDTLWNRLIDPGMFQNEYMYATTTFRRFSNISEATLVSEARKEYYFEYLFVPKNENETRQVIDIVGSFRKASYPRSAGLPERTYPQNLWTIEVLPGTISGSSPTLTADWLGEPMPCVLTTVLVKTNDAADPIVRFLPNGTSSVTVLGLMFREFETGTYVPPGGGGGGGQLLSKSEIAASTFGT
jgi:hypothetical protein